MILRSVELESFGRFNGQTVEFRRGLNLVIGPNEAGKSTLAEAIPAVLFGTDRLERFKPWGRNSCTATLFFEGRGRTIQVKRNLVTDEVELIEKDDLYHTLSQFTGKVPLRGRTSLCREYRDLLESLLGVSDERLFRATYFFGHHPQEWKGDELAQKLRSLVSGTAETDYAEILDNLLEEHFQLTRSNPWGRDKQRDREYETVCEALLQQGDSEAVPLFVEIDSAAEIDAQIAELTSQLEDDRKEYEKGCLYVERVRSQAQAAPVKKSQPSFEVSSERPVTSPAGDLHAKLVEAGLPANPPPELPQLLSEAADIRQELALFQMPLSEINTREKKAPDVPWSALIALVFLLSVGALLAWWLSFQAQILLPLFSFLALLLIGWGGWRQLTKRKILDACSEERSLLEQKKLLVQNRQAALSERCEELGLPTSAIDLVRLQKQASAHAELLQQWWQHGEAVNQETKGSEEDPSIVEDVADSTELPAGSTETERECDMQGELSQLQSRLNQFAAELKEKEAHLQALRLQRQESAEDRGDKAVPTAVDLQQRKRILEERIAVLRKAVDLLVGAVEEFGHSHLNSLNEEAGKLFGKITAGRYPELKLDENMTPNVRVDGRRWRSVENFSKGTVDAIYLALRIALTKLRDDGRSLPLILDDPFVHLDQKRLASALNMIDMASADGQLILLSHNLELGKRAARERWQVVPLDSDTIVSTAEEGGEHAGQLHLL